MRDASSMTSPSEENIRAIGSRREAKIMPTATELTSPDATQRRPTTSDCRGTPTNSWKMIQLCVLLAHNTNAEPVHPDCDSGLICSYSTLFVLQNKRTRRRRRKFTPRAAGIVSKLLVYIMPCTLICFREVSLETNSPHGKSIQTQEVDTKTLSRRRGRRV